MKQAGLDDGPREFDDLAEPLGRINQEGQRATTYRGFTDTQALRQSVLDGVKNAYANKVSENKQYALRFADVDYAKPKDFSLKDEKEALLNRRRLYWNLHGRLQLIDKATGQLISEDKEPRKLAEVPWLSRRGTWIHNGTEYLSFHQQRLKPGAYTRVQTNGDVETQFNVLRGSGFRVRMTPDTGVFKMKVGQGELKLYPVLKALGVDDRTLVEHWGKDLFNANKAADDKTAGTTLAKLVERLGRHDDQGLPADQQAQRLPEILARMEMDPGVTKRTLGKPYTNVNHEVILAATKKILGVHKGEVDGDVRDDLPYQSFHGPEDFFREHVEKDAGQYLRQALWKASWNKDTAKVPNGYFTKQLQSVLMGSGLAATLTEINPIEIFDMRHKITRMGEGGIGSTDVVPKDARGVQPTHFGFIDAIRAPESQAVALDLRVAAGAKVGSDGRLYQDMRNARTGKLEPVTTEDIAEKIVAFPGELKKARAQLQQPTKPGGAIGMKWGKVAAMVGGKMAYVPADQVDYELPHAAKMWSPVTYMVPYMAGIKGQRVSMGARMQTQALALREPEAPFVRSKHPDTGLPLHREIGKEMGAAFADKPGTVKSVDGDTIVVQHDDGTVGTHELYNNFPLNQKGFLHNTAVVKPGDRVNQGDCVARSNYTDAKGLSAIGRNVVAVYHPYDGLTHEDAVVISESAAKKFASEQMYEFSKERSDDIHDIGKASYVAKFGGTFNKAQLDTLDENGVARVGTILKKDDPIILAVGKRGVPVKGSITKGSKTDFSDAAETWEHEEPGEVVDVRKTTKGWVVSTKAYTPSKVGDKLSGLMGNKGIIAKVVPDADMLKTADGKTVDVVLNPAGIVSRVNPAQLAEASLGKIAMKTGKTYDVDGFPEHSIAQFALDELKKHGMNDTEEITDPRTGRKIKDVFVGVPYFMKLHHMAEGKLSARDTGGYSMDELPSRGGEDGAKRVSLMELGGLISHGATDFIEDTKLTRGQRNEDYWRLYRMGVTPPAPKVSKMYEKFEATLKAAGVHLRKEGSKTRIMPATQKEIDELAGTREITVADTVDFDSGDPVKGGLFDIGLTGGKDGLHWSHIKLAEPLPNPVVEEPIRSLLGLTKDRYRDIIAGKEDINGVKGPHAIAKALETFNVSRETAATVEAIKSGKKSIRDKMVKRLGFLKSFDRLGIHPRDFMLNKVPVLPPKFRPVTQFEGRAMSADANYLYKDLMEANHNVKASGETFGDAGEARLQLYDAFRAVTGLGGPITPENQERNVKGLLKQITGTSPKLGMYQRKIIGNPVDFSGRVVLAPGHDLDIDEVRLPVNMMWKMFKPFVVRRLVRQGMPAVQALKAIKERTPVAAKAFEAEYTERPVVINRAPSLTKLNMTGHFAKPTATNTLQVSNLILAGHQGDYDGDSGRFILELVIPEGTIWETYEGTPMPFSAQTSVAAVQRVRIQDIPVVQGSRVDISANISEYDVVPGVQIYALDPATLEHHLYPVTKFSVHADLDMRLVTLGKRFQTTLTVSADHSLICYKDGKVQPVKPDEAQGLMVPVVRHMDAQTSVASRLVKSVRFKSGPYSAGAAGPSAIPVEHDVQLTKDFGFFLGALIGDGWVDVADHVLLSNDDADVRDAWLRAGQEHTPLRGAGHVTTYEAESLGGKTTERNRVGLSCAWFARWLREQVGEGAKNKHIPSWCFEASDEHLLGILDGLMSTDGCVGLNTAREKPQLLISMSTISVDLVQDLQYLGRRLGFQVSVSLGKITQADNQSYVVTFSAPDFVAFQRRCGFSITAKWKQQRLEQYGGDVASESSCAASTDLVPYPRHLHEKIRAIARGQAPSTTLADRATTLVCTAAREGYWSRSRALSVLENVEDPEFSDYLLLVSDNKITWKQVLSVEVAPRETGYDLTVPGPLTFATHDGVIVQDTLTVHVPVSDKAVENVKEKMLPSKMLLSPGQFDVHMLPPHVFVTGLYVGSKKNDKKQPKTFETKAAAVKAYRSGEIDADDPVIILGGK